MNCPDITKEKQRSMMKSLARFLKMDDSVLHVSLLSQAGSKVFQLATAIVIGGLTARHLGPAGMGKISYVASIVGLLGPIGSLGTKESMSALLCTSNTLKGLGSSAFLMQIAGSLVAGVMIIPFAWLAGDIVMRSLFIFAFIATLIRSFEILEVQLLNKRMGKTVAKIDAYQSMAGTCLSISMLVARAPLLGFGIVPVVQIGIKSFLLWKVVCIRSFTSWICSARIETCKLLVARGWPFVLSGLTIMVYMKSDQVMIEWMKGSYAVGQYSAAVRVAESIYFMPMILSHTYLPYLGEHLKRGVEDQQGYISLRRFYRYTWLLGITMVTLTAVVLPIVLVVVYGSAYREAVKPLICLAPAVFAVATGTATGVWLNLKGYVDILFWRTALGALANIVLNLLLIPRYGITGAAIATSVSQLIAANLVELIDARTRSNQRLILFPYNVGPKYLVNKNN